MLLGRDWLEKICLNWATIAVQDLAALWKLTVHRNFSDKLGTILPFKATLTLHADAKAHISKTMFSSLYHETTCGREV